MKLTEEAKYLSDKFENIILRMALTSQFVRLMAFVFAVANQTNHSYAITMIGFWLLDSFYLSLERNFIVTQDHICLGSDNSLKPFKGFYRLGCYIRALFSPSELLTYLTFAYIIWK